MFFCIKLKILLHCHLAFIVYNEKPALIFFFSDLSLWLLLGFFFISLVLSNLIMRFFFKFLLPTPSLRYFNYMYNSRLLNVVSMLTDALFTHSFQSYFSVFHLGYFLLWWLQFHKSFILQFIICIIPIQCILYLTYCSFYFYKLNFGLFLYLTCLYLICSFFPPAYWTSRIQLQWLFKCLFIY